jgi:hypothetical protein
LGVVVVLDLAAVARVVVRAHRHQPFTLPPLDLARNPLVSDLGDVAADDADGEGVEGGHVHARA